MSQRFTATAFVALVLACLAAHAPARGEPVPSAAAGKGALAVSGDGRFGLFAGRTALVTWELGDPPRGVSKKQRVPLKAGAWSLLPSPSGDTTLCLTPDRVVEVMLLTGRVVVDIGSIPKQWERAREATWTPDGSQALLLGYELPELAPGDGTPLAYLDPKLGFVARQIRIPGLDESRGMVVRPNGIDVVIATPSRLLLLGLGVASVRTVSLGEADDMRLVGVVDDGIVALLGDRVMIMDPETARVLRTIDLPFGDPRRIATRPLSPWLVVERDKPREVLLVDLRAARHETLDVVGLGKPRAVIPTLDGVVAIGRAALVRSLPQ